MMIKMNTGFAAAIGLLVLAAAPANSADRTQAAAAAGNASKEVSIEMLQKATTLAVGNLAWESVKVSEVERSATSVKWLATTRSMKLNCTAAPDGANPYCDSGNPGAAASGAAATSGTATASGTGAGAGAGAGAGKASAASYPIRQNTVSVGGDDRPYSYFVSTRTSRSAFNFVVFALHGNGEAAEQFAETSGWPKIAEENGFAVVFPQAIRNTWTPYSGGDDDYLKAVYDHVRTHLLPADAGAPGGEGRRGGGGGAGGPGAGAPGGGGMRAANRIPTWPAFYYLTGTGAGGTAAQEFAINHPGLFAALATLDAAPYEAAYTQGNEPAQAYYQHMRPGKNVQPVWSQLKKDVPVAAWLFSSSGAGAAQSRDAAYWMKVNGVSKTAAARTIGGFSTLVYGNAQNEAQQVRMTAVAPATAYNEAMAAAIWSDLFKHVARWTSSPNGDLGRMLSEAEVNASFQVKSIDVGNGEPYKYYVKVPSTARQGQPLPIVICAHGANFPAWLYLSQIRMHELGEKEGFITVYPNGRNNMWDFSRADGPDQQFIEKMIQEVVATYGADRSRVYMQGFSLGSGLSFMLGITRPDLFAAVSPNNGIGPPSKEVQQWVDSVKAKSDARIPAMIVYGDVDSAASVDGHIPAQGVLRDAIDLLKKYNNITTPDRTEKLNSKNTAAYDVLVPGAKPIRGAVDKRYPDGRFQIYQYSSADPRPLDLFAFVWVTDLTHGADVREAKLEWDFFKRWRRNPDGTLTFAAR
jgi:poly(3-hydroxybutyrate) depolymerase